MTKHFEFHSTLIRALVAIATVAEARMYYLESSVMPNLHRKYDLSETKVK